MNSRQQAKNTLNLRVKQAGHLLAQSRWTECDTRVSPAGMAGSGDICADFWNPDNQLHTSTLPLVLRLSVSEIVQEGLC
jgi:hypothetical protein